MSSFLGHSLAAYSLFSIDRRGRASTPWRAMWLPGAGGLPPPAPPHHPPPPPASPVHQGSRIAHSIAFSLILPLLSVGVVYFVKGLKSQRKLLSVCAVLAGLSHLFLDFLVGVTPL